MRRAGRGRTTRSSTAPAALLACSMAALGWLTIAPAFAEGGARVYEESPSVDWYYASAFGTGRYRAGERTVAVLRIPAAWKLPEREGRDWSVRILAPLTLGAVDFGFEDIVGPPLDSVALVTFTPGVEFLVKAGESWLLRPFATLGGGAELDGGERAWIYSVGLSARRPMACAQWRCTLGLAFTGAGYRSGSDSRDAMSSLAAGVDFVAPPATEDGGRSWRPGMFAIYRNYLAGLDFIFAPEGLEPLSEEWEIGVSLTATPGFSILGYRFERIGLSYRRSSGLRGIHIVSRFPF